MACAGSPVFAISHSLSIFIFFIVKIFYPLQMDLSTAYMLLTTVGIEESIENYNKLYEALGTQCDSEILDSFLSKTKSTSRDEIMAKGDEIISSLASQVVSSQPAVTEAAPKKEEKVVEEVEEVVEVSLFGGDDDFF
ncbi:60S ACIDIC ribosomal protein P2 [Nosema bombycis CQ1]|uniref:60S ACIDIC ribosomal protein P2 n=2 Tax=Nosema bombycis TaxID=27978 RepID=R0MNS0_NOSB1|nr:60S ribosomal protein P2 [Nosema bombycis]EOB14508.1 60S ACIDIC ribosomal protein P2 [Nosema bombycis CQ1]|eukprot:EOB14508.1 60S ACIDIC ribosomal protein P2 [Nosema bombycis CQ1]